MFARYVPWSEDSIFPQHPAPFQIGNAEIVRRINKSLVEISRKS